MHSTRVFTLDTITHTQFQQVMFFTINLPRGFCAKGTTTSVCDSEFAPQWPHSSCKLDTCYCNCDVKSYKPESAISTMSWWQDVCMPAGAPASADVASLSERSENLPGSDGT